MAITAFPKFQNYISKRTGGPQFILVGIEISGLKELMAKVEQLHADGYPAMGKAMYAESLLVMRASKRLVPVRYGFLRASGHVKTPTITFTDVEVEMGFGGPAGVGNVGESNRENVGYALPVHENLNARHRVGQAKFLESPLLAAASGLETRLAKRVKALLKL